MKTLFRDGEAVRLTRNVRNDGTFPGTEVGELLIKRGSIGHIQKKQAEKADEPWLPSLFEFRDKVLSTKTLVVNGETIVEKGVQGEVVQIITDAPGVYQYHIRFPGKTIQVPESALEKDETRKQVETAE